MQADRVATPEEVAEWTKDAQQVAEFNNYDSPTVPDEVGTAVHDLGTEGIAVERAQDVEPILEHCKALAAAGQAWSPSRELMHAAEFPMVIVERYMAQKGITFDQLWAEKSVHFRNMMNDPALSHFLIARNVVQTLHR